MVFANLRLLLVAGCVIGAPNVGLAQQLPGRPTVDQAQMLLQRRPDLVQQLRQRLATSGLTPEQVRARLRAEGYPENLLDAYLSDREAGTGNPNPNGSQLDAIRALGIADSTDVETLRSLLPEVADSVTGARSDSARTVGGLRGIQRNRDEPDTLLSGALRPPPRGVYPKDGSRIFGLDLFQSSRSSFEPNLAGPVDASYRLGPGDELVLILTGDVEEAYQLPVTREGFVVIPQVGQIFVNGLTLGQLDQVLYSRLARVYSGVRRGADATTHFSVSVSKLHSNQVYVSGDVLNPGSYRVSSAGTAMTALYAAGGPSANGSLRRVEVKRAGRTVSTLDVYDYLLSGDASRDPRLQTGDVIFVPIHGAQVRLAGEVMRPATYEVMPSETLADLIRLAGGFTPAAATQRIQIERITPAARRTAAGQERTVIDVAAPNAGNGEAAWSTIRLEPGDIVTVFSVAKRVRNRITVVGNVWTPGTQGFVPGMKLSDAIKRAGGAQPDTYLGEVLVSRLNPDSTRQQLRATLRDTTGTVVNDFPLNDDDEIQLFSVSQFRPRRYIAVSGAVRRPGQFSYRQGMTMRDAIVLANGLEESAYLDAAEIARLPVDRSDGATAQTIRVPLDSSYLFERGADGHYAGPPGLPAPPGTAPDVVLQPYDNVLILQQPNWQLQRTVALSGQVRFPGKYSLRNKAERLASLIARAGGLTSEAYADGVQFFRTADRVGRIGLDLGAALANPRHKDNIELQNGDSIYVPSFSPVVTVTGAVQSPIAVSYVPGQTMEYYIAAAGGGTRDADLARAYVLQANGAVVSRRRLFPGVWSVPKPAPGSTVAVPRRDPNEKSRDYYALAANLAQALASIVAILAIARR